MFNSELKSKVIEITLAVYRVTDKFPKDEILKDKIRKRALDFAGRLIAWQFLNGSELEYGNLVADFEVIRAYFEIAKFQKWLDPDNFEVLDDEYWNIVRELKINKLPREEGGMEIGKNQKKRARGGINSVKRPLKERERAIVNCLRGNAQMRVGELSNIFSGLSKRTLRRDIEKLCGMGIIERIGTYNETSYKLKDNIDLQTTIGQESGTIGQTTAN